MKLELKHKIRPVVLISSISIPLLTGILSAYLTSEDIKAYETMNHPPLSPPAWLFPIAWTILYILMGTASYIVYTSEADQSKKRKALLFYTAQLVMNFYWCTLFFTYSQYLISLIWIAAMWVLVLICGLRFFRIRRSASLMMGILLLWTTFATYLNLATYIMSITPMPIK